MFISPDLANPMLCAAMILFHEGHLINKQFSQHDLSESQKVFEFELKGIWVTKSGMRK